MSTEQELIAKGFHNRNHITGRFYLGEKNQIALNQAGFSTPEWLTFLQIKQNGYKLRKGSEGIEVVYSEPVEKEEIDSNGNVITKSVPRLIKHIVFNLEQIDKVSDHGSTFSVGKQTNTYNFMKSSNKNQEESDNEAITQKQRLYLIKLIESRYEDEKTKAGLLNRINELSKIEAKAAIATMLQETR